LNLAKLHHFGGNNVAFEKCMNPKRAHTFLEDGYYKSTCYLETNQHPYNWETLLKTYNVEGLAQRNRYLVSFFHKGIVSLMIRGQVLIWPLQSNSKHNFQIFASNLSGLESLTTNTQI
jgi:hypothetical protein